MYRITLFLLMLVLLSCSNESVLNERNDEEYQILADHSFHPNSLSVAHFLAKSRGGTEEDMEIRRLEDYEQLNLFFRELEILVGTKDLKKLKDNRVIEVYDEINETVSLTVNWVREPFALVKLVIITDKNYDILNSGVLRIEINKEADVEHRDNMIDLIKSAKLYKIKDYIKKSNDSDIIWEEIKDCLDLLEDISDSGSNGGSDGGTGGTGGAGNPGNGGGSGGGKECYMLVCGCVSHPGGYGAYPKCRCTNKPNVFKRVPCPKGGQEIDVDAIEVNKSSNSIWDCIETLVEIGLLSDLDLIEMKLDNCEGLGSTLDIDLLSGGNENSEFDDSSFCTSWESYEDECLQASSEEEAQQNTTAYAEYYFTCPQLFLNTISNPSNCIAKDQIDCYCESMNEFEESYDLDLNKIEWSLVTATASSLELNEEINCSHPEEYAETVVEALFNYRLVLNKVMLDYATAHISSTGEETTFYNLYGYGGLTQRIDGIWYYERQKSFEDDDIVHFKYDETVNPNQWRQIYKHELPVEAHLLEQVSLAIYNSGHDILNYMGLIPVAGEVFDGINSIWYFGEGDYTNGAISGASLIPFAGTWVGGSKAVRNTLKLSDNLLQSKQGLNYARRYYSSLNHTESALSHVHRHTVDNLNKPIHGIFDDPSDVVGIIDEAYVLFKNNSNIISNTTNGFGNVEIIINLQKNIGKQGGKFGNGSTLQNLKLVFDPNTNNVITAFPK